MKPEEPVDQKYKQPILINCTSGPRGRICRYTWPDGTVEWFLENEAHKKGLGRPVPPDVREELGRCIQEALDPAPETT